VRLQRMSSHFPCKCNFTIRHTSGALPNKRIEQPGILFSCLVGPYSSKSAFFESGKIKATDIEQTLRGMLAAPAATLTVRMSCVGALSGHFFASNPPGFLAAHFRETFSSFGSVGDLPGVAGMFGLSIMP
jgi:hypothetical protein